VASSSIRVLSKYKKEAVDHRRYMAEFKEQEVKLYDTSSMNWFSDLKLKFIFKRQRFWN